MLKADITKERTKLEINGDLSDICTDLTRILSAINERLSERDAGLGHSFRVMFTKGFMDGICFSDDREHMEHYLAEGDASYKKNKEQSNGTIELLETLIDFLKERRTELSDLKRKIDELAEDDSDEAE